MGDLLGNLKKNREESSSNKFFTVIPKLPLWKASEGKKKCKKAIRVLPPTKSMDYWYVDYWAHFNMGSSKKEQCICGRAMHGSCPICDVLSEIYDLRQEQGDRYDKMAQMYKAKRSNLAHILDQENPNIVQIGMLSSSVEQQITSIMIGEELSEDGDDSDEEVEKIDPLGDITHYKSGRWVMIYVNPGDPKTYYKVKPFKSATPIAKSMSAIKDILNQRTNLQKLIQAATLDMSQLEAYADKLRRSLRLGSTMSLDEAEANVSSSLGKKKKKSGGTSSPADETDDLSF